MNKHVIRSKIYSKSILFNKERFKNLLKKYLPATNKINPGNIDKIVEELFLEKESNGYKQSTVYIDEIKEDE